MPSPLPPSPVVSPPPSSYPPHPHPQDTKGDLIAMFASHQAQSVQAQQERDLALKKSKRLEEEMDTIRVYYR